MIDPHIGESLWFESADDKTRIKCRFAFRDGL
jgi:hypothetical protein